MYRASAQGHGLVGLWTMLAVFFTLSFFVSPYLDTHDAVQFALAVESFDIEAHQPHPPGYPVYVFLARHVAAGHEDPAAQMSLLSALGGAVALAFMLLIVLRLYEPRVALIAVGFTLLAPSFVIASLVAMNDTLALAFVAAAAYYMLLSAARPGWLLLGALLAGLALGVRPQYVVLLGLLYLVALAACPSLRVRLFSLVTGALGVLAWLVPTAISQGGLLHYLSLGNNQFEGYRRFRYTPEGVLDFISLIGEGWRSVVVVVWIVLLAHAIACVAAGWRPTWPRLFTRVGIHQPHASPHGYMLLWFVGTMLTLLTFYVPHLGRYILPLLLPMGVWLAHAALYFLSNRCAPLTRGAFAVLAGAVVVKAIIGAGWNAYAIHSFPPPRVAGMQYIREHLDPQRTVLLLEDARRFADYYAPEYQLFVGSKPPQSERWRRLSSAAEVIVTQNRGPFGTLSETHTFQRDVDPLKEEHRLFVYRKPPGESLGAP